MKLNLGCGRKRLDGYVNVDHHGAFAPDVEWDLERFPWPFEDGCAEEVLLVHVLEHLGATPAAFMGVVRELWRVCRDGALVEIHVPHPRHDDFLSDPTHVRPITPDTLNLFDLEQNRRWETEGAANSLLAIAAGVDFRIEGFEYVLEESWYRRYAEGELDGEALDRAVRERNNVVKEIKIRWRARKG